MSDITPKPDGNCRFNWVMLRTEVSNLVKGSNLVMPDVTAEARTEFLIEDWGPDAKEDLKKGAKVIIKPDCWGIPVLTDSNKFVLVRDNEIVWMFD